VHAPGDHPKTALDPTGPVHGFCAGDARRFPYAIFRRFKGLIAPTIVGVLLRTLALVKTPLWLLNLCLGPMVLIVVLASMFKWEFRLSARREKILSPLFVF
jgi:hypothetical protein